jgi:hypothetical protein
MLDCLYFAFYYLYCLRSCYTPPTFTPYLQSLVFRSPLSFMIMFVASASKYCMIACHTVGRSKRQISNTSSLCKPRFELIYRERRLHRCCDAEFVYTRSLENTSTCPRHSCQPPNDANIDIGFRRGCAGITAIAITFQSDWPTEGNSKHVPHNRTSKSQRWISLLRPRFLAGGV